MYHTATAFLKIRKSSIESTKSTVCAHGNMQQLTCFYYTQIKS